MSSTNLTDPWKKVYVDKDGINRCEVCQHARPSTFQRQSTVQSQYGSNQYDNSNQDQPNGQDNTNQN